ARRAPLVVAQRRAELGLARPADATRVGGSPHRRLAPGLARVADGAQPALADRRDVDPGAGAGGRRLPRLLAAGARAPAAPPRRLRPGGVPVRLRPLPGGLVHRRGPLRPLLAPVPGPRP